MDSFATVLGSLNQYNGSNAIADIKTYIERLKKGRKGDNIQELGKLLSALSACDHIPVNYLRTTLDHCRVTVLKHPDPASPERFVSLIYLAKAAEVSFRETENIDDLDEVITMLKQLINLYTSAPRDSDLPDCLQWFAQCMLKRFNLNGRIEDLHGSCESLERELFLLSTSSPPSQRATTLGSLGRALLLRFKLLARRQDLDRAIECHTEAVELQSTQSHISYTLALDDLADDLMKSFAEIGNKGDLFRAIDLYQEARDIRLPNQPLLHQSLNHLGHAVTIYIQELDDTDHPTNIQQHLEQAISLHHNALALCGANYEGRVGYLADLIFTERIFAEKAASSYSSTQLQEAIDLGTKQLLPAIQPSHAHLVDACKNVAFLLLRAQDYDKAFSLFRRGAEQETAGARERFSVAIEWAAAARDAKHDSAEEAYRIAMDLFDRCQIMQLTVESKHEFLSRHLTVKDAVSLSSDAASLAMENDRLEDAVEILERGRTFVWAMMRGYRPELTDLRRASPALADKFQTLSTDIERFATLSLPHLVNTSSGDSISQGWQTTLNEIRGNVAGFRDFLAAEPYEDLLRAADEGPIVMFSVSTYGNDALILYPPDTIVDRRVVRVPLGNAEEIKKLILRHVSILSWTYLPGFLQSMSLDRSSGTSQAITEVLEGIWKLIMRPVETQLVKSGITPLSRIWLCPTGSLAVLPLHAAGMLSSHYTPPVPEDSHFIPSYTSSLSALITARQHLEDRLEAAANRKTSEPDMSTHTPNLLFVGVPDAPGVPRLPGVVRERDVVRSCIPSGTDLIGPSATRQRILDQMLSNNWIHFACHGLHDEITPFDSSFMAHDEPLTLRDLMTLRLETAELAFLSACETAVTTLRTPDEVLHLGAAAQFSGFTSVIGTLWTMLDKPEIAQEFYRYMFRNPNQPVNIRESAEALYHTLMTVRKSSFANMGPQTWICFVHIGV